MTPEQQEDYLAFVANFVNMLRTHKVKRKQAEILTNIAASVLLPTVLHVDPRTVDEITEAYVVSVVKTALKMQYGNEVVAG